MHRICDRRVDLAVSLMQIGVDKFTVTYGSETTRVLTYVEAAKEYGLCVMHALACEGKLDNRSSSIMMTPRVSRGVTNRG
jgi:hypothetical protein